MDNVENPSTITLVDLPKTIEEEEEDEQEKYFF